ncbi:hypothetical protein [Salinispira pacifica]
MDTLTDEVLAYQRNGQGYCRLISEISLLVYNYPRRSFGFTEDDRGEFLLFFYPRIGALINRFRPIGRPFEVYLRSTLRWQLKSYAARRSREQRRLRFFARHDLWVDLLGDPSRDRGEPAVSLWDPILNAHHNPRTDETGRVVDRSLRRRLLLLGMKSSSTLTPTEMEELVRLTGSNRCEMAHQCEALRLRMSAREARYEVLSARRNRAYVRMQCLQEEVMETPAGERLDRLQGRYRKLAQRFDRAHHEAAAVIRTATHRELAETLGVPKGSIDSGIFYLRSAIEKRGRFRARADSCMIGS